MKDQERGTEEQCPHKGFEEVGAGISIHQDCYFDSRIFISTSENQGKVGSAKAHCSG